MYPESINRIKMLVYDTVVKFTFPLLVGLYKKSCVSNKVAQSASDLSDGIATMC